MADITLYTDGAARGNVPAQNGAHHHLAQLTLQARAAVGGEMEQLVAHGSIIGRLVSCTIGNWLYSVASARVYC